VKSFHQHLLEGFELGEHFVHLSHLREHSARWRLTALTSVSKRSRIAAQSRAQGPEKSSLIARTSRVMYSVITSRSCRSKRLNNSLFKFSSSNMARQTPKRGIATTIRLLQAARHLELNWRICAAVFAGFGVGASSETEPEFSKERVAWQGSCGLSQTSRSREVLASTPASSPLLA
jgi:hypothetical protein